MTARIGVSPQLSSNIQRTSKSQSPIDQQASHLDSTTILKGWESISPGLRGTSYPGSAITKTNFTLKRVISARFPIGGTDQMRPASVGPWKSAERRSVGGTPVRTFVWSVFWLADAMSIFSFCNGRANVQGQITYASSNELWFDTIT